MRASWSLTTCLVWSILCTGPAAAASLGGRSVAVLIGVDTYADRAWSALEAPSLDVTALQPILEGPLGFDEVVVLLDEAATREAITETLDDVLLQAAPGDSVLIYFSGHGYFDGETSYWVPTDGPLPADPNDHGFMSDHLISSDQVLAWAHKSRALHVLLIADSCYGGELTRQRSGGDVPRPGWWEDAYYDELSQARSVEVISAGGVEAVPDRIYSPRGGAKLGGHSPFAFALLTVLSSLDAPRRSAAELFTAIGKVVASLTPPSWPRPRYGVHDANLQEASGSFVFERAGFPIPTDGYARLGLGFAEGSEVLVNGARLSGAGRAKGMATVLAAAGTYDFVINAPCLAQPIKTSMVITPNELGQDVRLPLPAEIACAPAPRFMTAEEIAHGQALYHQNSLILDYESGGFCSGPPIPDLEPYWRLFASGPKLKNRSYLARLGSGAPIEPEDFYKLVGASSQWRAIATESGALLSIGAALLISVFPSYIIALASTDGLVYQPGRVRFFGTYYPYFATTVGALAVKRGRCLKVDLQTSLSVEEAAKLIAPFNDKLRREIFDIDPQGLLLPQSNHSVPHPTVRRCEHRLAAALPPRLSTPSSSPPGIRPLSLGVEPTCPLLLRPPGLVTAQL